MKLKDFVLKLMFANTKFILCGIYRPPNSWVEYWDSLERTFETLINSLIKDFVIYVTLIATCKV